jgi:hypothetical protein
MHEEAPMTTTSRSARPALLALAITATAGCASAPQLQPPPPAAAPAPAAPASAAAATPALAFAVFQPDGSTAQGGMLAGFAYSEKPGDATFDKVVVTNGAARVHGTVWPQKGSTWAGIGFTASAGADGKTRDLSRQRTLHVQLAAATATQLRVRLLGEDKATRDNGCYPVVMQAVTAELRDYAIELSRFTPEAYCGAQGRSIAATAPAVAAIEVSDPALTPGTERMVDFQVGRIELKP